MSDRVPLTSDPVVAPTKEILRIATLIGELTDRVIEGYAPHTRICRRNSDVEAHAMLWLIIRNAETVCYLAQIDLGFNTSRIIYLRVVSAGRGTRQAREPILRLSE
jgi:hypothetical protein